MVRNIFQVVVLPLLVLVVGGYPADVFSMNDNTTGISVSVGNNTTNGDSIENRPPYMALCYIMKT